VFAATVVSTIAIVVSPIAVAGALPAPAPALQGNVTPQLPATLPSKVAVVASSALQDGKVAVIVANGSSSPARNIVVTGVATRADGGAVTRARTRVTVPAVVAPGAIALAGLDFSKRGVDPGATVTFRVRSSATATSGDSRLLEARALTLSAPLEGAVAQTLGAQLVNTGARALRGPVRVTVMCFDEARRPVVATTKVLRARKLAPGQSVHTTVPLATLCPTYLVGARVVG
jgi:hypothetical protein